MVAESFRDMVPLPLVSSEGLTDSQIQVGKVANYFRNMAAIPLSSPKDWVEGSVLGLVFILAVGFALVVLRASLSCALFRHSRLRAYLQRKEDLNDIQVQRKHKGKEKGSLNSCPYNLEAERLAMEDCMRGLDVRREWSETEMVSSFGGGMIPGTPDGMFEEWQGVEGKSRLTCVQVVRAPIHRGMDFDEIEEVLYQTVLTKIWKSQMWMKSTHIVPDEFIIFLWKPFQSVEGTGEKAQALIEKCRQTGWPFVFRCKVPAEPGSIFPLMFAWQGAGREGGMEGRFGKKRSKVSEADLSTFFPQRL
jgi:hypothetical protein